MLSIGPDSFDDDIAFFSGFCGSMNHLSMDDLIVRIQECDLRIKSVTTKFIAVCHAAAGTNYQMTKLWIDRVELSLHPKIKIAVEKISIVFKNMPIAPIQNISSDYAMWCNSLLELHKRLR